MSAKISLNETEDMSLKVHNINYSFFNDDDIIIWNSLLKKMNWQQKNKIFQNLIKNFFTDIQPNELSFSCFIFVWS